jgi:hypothetical protein
MEHILNAYVTEEQHCRNQKGLQDNVREYFNRLPGLFSHFPSRAVPNMSKRIYRPSPPTAPDTFFPEMLEMDLNGLADFHSIYDRDLCILRRHGNIIDGRPYVSVG